MGQYFHPVSIEKREHVYSHFYNQGLKLMEHSWLGNKFVGVVEDLIAKGGDWYGDKIVWAGDYAEREKNRKSNLYELCKTQINPETSKNDYQYLINMDTKEFIDMGKGLLSSVWVDPDTGEVFPYSIHPLPLMTCEGNGQGGGDFHKDEPIVGTWARNRVTVANEVPEDYTEIEFNLYEGNQPAELPDRNAIAK